MTTVAVASSRRRENIDADNPPILHMQNATDDRTACGISTAMPWWELDVMDLDAADFARHGCQRCKRHFPRPEVQA